MGRMNRWGIAPAVLKAHVYKICEHYRELTLRTLHYRLVQVYDYPNELGFYKFLSRWCSRWRREDPELNEKFVDLSRLPVIPIPGLSKFEAWFEKDAAWIVVRDILERYRVPVQVERGYGSVGMFAKAIRRAHRRGVETIAFYGDWDPSGLDIERVTREIMVPVRVERVALTLKQVRQFDLPPRPAKPKDRRTPKFIERHGPNTFEIEAMDPRILRQITERAIRRLVPSELIREIRLREKASRIATELLRPIRERVEEVALRLLKQGLSLDEIRSRLRGVLKFS
jgi:hypothetical protein